MRKYLDLTSWILLFFFAPFTVLILLSQNSIPGDFFYPVKRGLENIILVTASVSPTTKVAFRTDFTQRRFTEAQQLLVLRADTTGFSDLVTEVSSTQQELSTVSNSQDKIQNADKIIAKIEEYQVQLSQTQNQVQIAQGLSTPVSPGSQAGSSFQSPPPQEGPSGFQSQSNPPVQQVPTPTPSQPGQTPQPIQQPVQNQPIATPPPAAPTNIPTPQPLTPKVTNEIANNPQKAEEVKEKIKDTNEHLEKIKEKVKKEKETAQVEEKIKEEQQKLKEQIKNAPTATPHNK